MIYITGDIHGNQFKWLEQIDPVLKEGDIIIVCGDFGIGFFQQKYSSEESFYDFISEQPYTVLFIDGKCETKINQNVQKKTNLKTSLNNLEKIE